MNVNTEKDRVRFVSEFLSKTSEVVVVIAEGEAIIRVGGRVRNVNVGVGIKELGVVEEKIKIVRRVKIVKQGFVIFHDVQRLDWLRGHHYHQTLDPVHRGHTGHKHITLRGG